MKKFWIVLICLAVVFAFGLGIVWRLVTQFEPESVRAEGVIHWRVNSAYAEERDDSIVGQVMHGRPPVMREVVLALARAAQDSRIEGLLLDISALPVDWAKVEELRDGVAAFAESGKPVVAFMEVGSTKEYALAVAANDIVMAPEGNLMVLGVSAELTFLKQTLSKLGMEADFVHVGQYKSAPEQLTREAPSLASREMAEAIITERYETLLDMISRGRGQSLATVREWVDTGVYDAGGALSAGLVDSVLCLEEVQDQYFPDAQFTDLEDYIYSVQGGRATTKIALIHVTGTIVSGESRFDNFQGKLAGSQTVIEQLQDARETDDIAAVILRVDSPGGSAGASDLIWHELERLRQEKPVFVSMSGYAASGGYYISCGADSIFAEPGTLTGSIGVYAGKVSMEGLYNKIGVHREYITRGENALLFNNNAVFSPGQRDRMQFLLDSFYERFCTKVAEGRSLDMETTHEIAQGRVWTGAQAQATGLVDGLGGLSRTLRAAKLWLGMDPTDRVGIVSYEKQLTFFERMLIRSFHKSVQTALPAPPVQMSAVWQQDGSLAALSLLDGRTVALMPWRIHFE
ncbi:MAG: signal peptide peptidase SppA [bacterium]